MNLAHNVEPQDARPDEFRDVEIDLVLEAIHCRYGYDFRRYARPTIARRLAYRALEEKLQHISELIPRLLHDESLFEKILSDFSITVTEVFRDPGFFLAFREKVVPYIKTFPFLKVWHAGCATGEEAYSIAILLEEARYYSRTRIYATDINTRALQRAKRGVFENREATKYADNYHAAGGISTLSDYYDARNGSFEFQDRLKKNMTFAHHNLVTDRVFAEIDVIICRNVLIYFDWALQEQVIDLFRQSLSRGGILCLGPKESIHSARLSQYFETLCEEERIYRLAR